MNDQNNQSLIKRSGVGLVKRSSGAERLLRDISHDLLERINHEASLGRGLAQRFKDRLPDGAQGPEMVILPAGQFRMGDLSSTGNGEERPVHFVRFSSPFALGAYPVTFGEYDLFARATKRNLPDDEFWGRHRRPVIDVSWDDATAYCEWLSDQTGQFYRLPSEAEWEYACRAGSESQYSWGDVAGENNANCDDCNHAGNVAKTTPVGHFMPNSWGLSDMHGNVWEWCQDCWHDDYQGAPTDGSAWTSGGDCFQRVLRGGSWIDAAEHISSSKRCRAPKNYRYCLDGGFRVAKTL